MRRKLALISATVALGALLVVGGTMAYFTGTADKTNTITTYGDGVGLNGAITVIEHLPDLTGKQYTATATVGDNNVVTGSGIAYGNVVPGMTIDKDPSVNYTGTVDAYVRYRVVALKNEKQADGSIVAGTEEIELNKLEFKKGNAVVDPMNPTAVATDSQKDVKLGVGADGKSYIYFNEAWTKNDAYELFDQVTFKADEFDNTFLGATIYVVADGVAKDGLTYNTSATDTEDPWGGVVVEGTTAP